MVHCDLCEVEIPDGPDAMLIHETGKKHVQVQSARARAISLATRSVFVKCLHGKGLNQELVTKIFKERGSIERVICKGDFSSYAIVEFDNEDEPRKLVEEDKIVYEETVLQISARKVNFATPQGVIDSVDINVAKVLEFAHNQIGFCAQLDAITTQISLDEKNIAKRVEICSRITSEFSKFFVSPAIRLFGSSITHLGVVGSDIDASLMFDPTDSLLPHDLGRDKFTLLTCDPQLFKGRKIEGTEVSRLSSADRVRFICRILNEIRKENDWLTGQRQILDAKCPIVRFVVDKSVVIDLSVENRIGCAKSEYLKCLVETDKSSNLRLILLGFRFWAYANGLFDPPANQHKGQFNAYMLYLLAISFMQREGILPRFQHSDAPVYDGIWRIDFHIPSFDLTNIDFSSLFNKMFVYFAQYDVSRVVVLREDPVHVELFKKTAHADFKLGFLNLQDPFELSHNVCQNLGQKSLALMRQRMMFGLSSLKKTKDDFTALLCLEDTRSSNTLSSLTLNGSIDAQCLIDVPSATTSSHVNSIVNIFDVVLAMQKEEEPISKRRRLDETSIDENSALGVFVVPKRLWIGRRNVKRQLAKSKGLQGLELEKEVSREMSASQPQDESPVAKVAITIGRSSKQLSIGFSRLAGTHNDITDLAHFLDVLIKNHSTEIFGVENNEIPME